MSTEFSGLIENVGQLVKIGSGTLTLSGANTYAGGTTVSAAALMLSNTTGSATGTGSVAVNGGTLGGGGTISGAVTVGSGNGAGATLQPSFGTTKKIALTIQSLLTFKTDATYSYRLKSRAAEVVANGVTIESGAQFTLVAPNKKLSAGKSATVIKNTAATPISGVFADLPDGATITSGNNTFRASYEGGDGNDLTLTACRNSDCKSGSAAAASRNVHRSWQSPLRFVEEDRDERSQPNSLRTGTGALLNVTGGHFPISSLTAKSA